MRKRSDDITEWMPKITAHVEGGCRAYGASSRTLDGPWCEIDHLWGSARLRTSIQIGRHALSESDIAPSAGSVLFVKYALA